MRLILRMLFVLVVLLLISPFLLSSLLVDQRGLIIPGRITAKDEWIVVQYSSWVHNYEATVSYQPPDEYSATVMKMQLAPDRYDSLKKGDVIKLRYLLRKDLPDWPALKTVRQMHILYSVRSADESTWTGATALIEQYRLPLITLLMAGSALLLWRLLRLPFLSWAIVTCILLGVVFDHIARFPKPTRAPRRDVRTASASVKRLESWRFLFQSTHSRSTIRWIAAQPISVVGVEFIPEGKRDSVVAVDLIDEGSLPGLAEHSAVNVDYEKTSPRVAYIRGGERRFAERNLNGLIFQLFDMLVVTAALFGVLGSFRLLLRKLTRRPVS